MPERWLEAVDKNGSSLVLTEISAAEGAREHLLMVLRLSEGLDLAEYKARWGEAPAGSQIRSLSEHGLVAQSGTRLSVTPKGRLVLNAVIAELAA